MSLSDIKTPNAQEKWGANPLLSKPSSADQASDKQGFFSGSSGPGFSDLVDTINPLHHLPVVNKVYEKTTGDTIAPAAKIAGGFLMGGVLGAAAALASCIFDQATGDGSTDTHLAKNDDPSRDEKPSAEQVALENQPAEQELAMHLHDVEDVVDVSLPLADGTEAPLQTALAGSPVTSNAAAMAVPLNPFRTLAQTAAAQAQTQGVNNPQDIASISRALWQRMERVYGESQALEPLYAELSKADRYSSLA